MVTATREPAAPAGPPPSAPPPHTTQAAVPAPDAPFSMRAIVAPLFAIVLGTFMAILDNTVVNVALRSEEHTSELQSLAYLVCRLLLEKKKKEIIYNTQQMRNTII